MRQGVSGFQGTRLTQAREGRGLTQSALAIMIARSSTAISRWESGEQLPEQEALISLERHLQIPASWFLKPLPDYGDKPFFFRSKAAITKSARLIAKFRLELAHEVSVSLQDWVEWPSVDIPYIDAADWKLLTDEDIERLAGNIRKHWKLGLGPLSDTTLLLENAGVVIAREEIGHSKMDGLSKWFDIDNRPYMFLASDKANPTRQRFDTAHELGHLVLHRHLTDIEFNTRHKELERQADLFAGAFLLPAESFSSEVSAPSLDTFKIMKSRWKTSVASMVFRSKQLGVISEDYAQKLWKNYSVRGWRRGEPGESDLQFEEIRLMPRAINLLLSDAGFDQDRLISEIGLFRSDIESLCSLKPDTLLNRKNNVVQMRLRSSDVSSDSSLSNTENKVLDFEKYKKLN